MTIAPRMSPMRGFTLVFLLATLAAVVLGQTTTSTSGPTTDINTTVSPPPPTVTSTGTVDPSATILTTATLATTTPITSTTVPPTSAAPGATPGPTTAAPECEPSCRVNLYFSTFLQTSNNIQASLIAVAAAAGVGTVARVTFNTRHSVYSGIPYGNGTLVTATISSFPVGTCNNFTNAQGCDLLVNQSNAPTLAAGLALVGVTNGTRIAADATIPTFGILASVSSLYLALYVGSGLGYFLFAVWSAYKFLVAYQLMVNERARDAAELIGLTLEELEQRKKDEEVAKNRKKAAGGRRTFSRPPQPAEPQKEEDDPYGDAFAATDVDDPAKQSLELIVSRMRHRSSHSFREEEYRRDMAMQREMVAQPSRSVLDAVAGAALPPVFVDPAKLLAIRRGGLVDAMELPEVQLQQQQGPAGAHPNSAGTFQRRQPSSAPEPNTPMIIAHPTSIVQVEPTMSHPHDEIDKFL